jgi:signal transduction histidine kinase/ligand-binding sensor domain-containing protein
MKNRFPIYILFLLLSLAKDVASQTQQVKFNAVSGTNGVSLGKINAITRDKYGFMWFSDQSNRCIVRFDGSHMTRYQNDPRNPNTLGGYYPECLFADAEGNIWIGFYGMGLDKFDPVTKSFTHYRHQKNNPQSLNNDSVTSILIDHLGNIWVGNYGGLDLLDEKTGKFKHHSHNPADASSLSNNKVRALYEDKAGELWVGTGAFFDNNTEGGLNRFNRKTGTFTRYLNDPKDPQSIINNKVRSIFEDSRGTFWIGTAGDGLHTMERKTGLFKRLTYNPAKPEQLSRPPVIGSGDNITFITEDADKEIWIGTMSNGIIRYDPQSKKITQYGNKADKTRALKDSTSWWANATPEGFIWLSTQNSNLFKIDIYNIIVTHFGNNLTDGVRAFSEETDSVFWYGTNSGLIRKDFKNGITRRFVNVPGNKNSLSNNVVTEILKDKQRNFWIGTRNGLNYYDLKTGNFIRYLQDSNNNNTTILNKASFFSLCEDRDSNIWAGTFGGGLYMLNRKSGKFTRYQNDPADINTISNDVITALLEDETTDLWIGTENNAGLNKMNRLSGRVTHYLPGLSVSSIYRDDEGIIWVGTANGLFRYHRKSDTFISNAEENSGFNIVQIAAITEDEDNNLWISAESGMYLLNEKRDQVVRYAKENGIRENNFTYYGASFKRQNGELYFGDELGYIAFYPDKLKNVPGTTQLYFTRFWVNDEEIIPGKKGLLHESLFLSKEIRLNHNQNVFSFSATFIDFRNTGDKKIYYKLENYDKDWHTSGAEERIHYFKVPPGKYVFRIKTPKSSNGEWAEKSIVIIISPPWWTTWWAYSIYGLLFIVLVFFIDRFQKERLIKTERERARTKELAQAKEIEKAYHELKVTQTQLIQSEKMASLGELTAGIAHEIQNPLNFVNNFSEVSNELLDEMNEQIDERNFEEVKTIASDVKQNLEKILHHGKQADAIVKGMLQHSRSSTNQKEPTDINKLADEYLRLCYHGLRAKDPSFNVTIKTDFDQSLEEINLIPQDIGRVLLNLYTNAFYAVNEKKQMNVVGYEPTVTVTTKIIGDRIEIKVADNGNGIPQKVLDKIFQPFFTTKPTGQGTGLGLSLSYDIVKAHGGELKVETKEGEGAVFICQLPH